MHKRTKIINIWFPGKEPEISTLKEILDYTNNEGNENSNNSKTSCYRLTNFSISYKASVCKDVGGKKHIHYWWCVGWYD